MAPDARGSQDLSTRFFGFVQDFPQKFVRNIGVSIHLSAETTTESVLFIMGHLNERDTRDSPKKLSHRFDIAYLAAHVTRVVNGYLCLYRSAEFEPMYLIGKKFGDMHGLETHVGKGRKYLSSFIATRSAGTGYFLRLEGIQGRNPFSCLPIRSREITLS
jgi:hypothetical protein